MPSHRYLLIFVLMIAVFLCGCYNTSQRHLASDASLIKAGSSSRNDVITYLGEPDKRRTLADGREEWLFIEDKTSTLQRTPMVGGYFSSKGRERILIILENDIVTSCQFSAHDRGEFDWADDDYRPENKE